MTPELLRMKSHVDKHETRRRLARLSKNPWSVHKENKTMRNMIMLALFAVAIYAFGCWYYGSWEWLGDVSK